MFEPSKIPLGVSFLFVLVCFTKKDFENTRDNQGKNIYLQNSQKKQKNKKKLCFNRQNPKTYLIPIGKTKKRKNRPMLQPSELPIDLLFLLKTGCGTGNFGDRLWILHCPYQLLIVDTENRIKHHHLGPKKRLI